MFTIAPYALSLYIFTTHSLTIRHSTTRSSKLSLSLCFAKGNIRICHFLHACCMFLASNIFYFVIRMHKLRTLICNFFHLPYRNIWTVKLKLSNNIPPTVYSRSQFSLELASLMKEDRIEWCIAFLRLPKKRVLTYKLKATTDTLYKGNTAYMRIWHQFRAEYDE